MRSFMLSSLLLSLVACVGSSDSIMTSDSTGQPVAVSLGNREIVVESADREAKLAWTDAAVTIEAGDVTEELARIDESGRWQLKPENPAIARLGSMLAAAEQVAVTRGVELPWRAVVVEENQSLAAVCDTGSTWVFGSSCYACYNAVIADQVFYGTRSSRSCDSGTIYTSCSMTYCF